ncbi:MAG: hypothetical protein WCK90_05050 [archaeon]
MENILNKVQSIVIKIGSSGITTDHDIDRESIKNLAVAAKELRDLGKKVTIVTSGAIAAGRRELSYWDESDLATKQMLAAVGQPVLMREYSQIFSKYGLSIGQFLVKKADFENGSLEFLRQSYKRTLDQGVIALFNENDTTAVEEIKFSDNDNLQELIINYLGGDLMVNLIKYDGFLKNGQVLSESNVYNSEFYDNLSGKAREGRGGLQGKLDAIRKVTEKGKYCIVGNVKGNILGMIEGRAVHTRFKT